MMASMMIPTTWLNWSKDLLKNLALIKRYSRHSDWQTHPTGRYMISGPLGLVFFLASHLTQGYITAGQRRPAMMSADICLKSVELAFTIVVVNYTGF
jgi:hypothetical protein